MRVLSSRHSQVLFRSPQSAEIGHEHDKVATAPKHNILSNFPLVRANESTLNENSYSMCAVVNGKCVKQFRLAADAALPQVTVVDLTGQIIPLVQYASGVGGFADVFKGSWETKPKTLMVRTQPHRLPSHSDYLRPGCHKSAQNLRH